MNKFAYSHTIYLAVRVRRVPAGYPIIKTIQTRNVRGTRAHLFSTQSCWVGRGGLGAGPRTLLLGRGSGRWGVRGPPAAPADGFGVVDAGSPRDPAIMCTPFLNTKPLLRLQPSSSRGDEIAMRGGCRARRGGTYTLVPVHLYTLEKECIGMVTGGRPQLWSFSFCTRVTG